MLLFRPDLGVSEDHVHVFNPASLLLRILESPSKMMDPNNRLWLLSSAMERMCLTLMETI